tara:strand:- start:454 stop:795 length:342 start_codon:yes stop_codon:yes gene_type:complete
MANKPLHAYTVAEASNLQVYQSYKCQILTLSGATEQATTTWDTPAKEVVFYSPGGVADDDGITISLKVNGAHGQDIVLAHDNLPFTVKGMLIEEVVIHGGSGDDDAITVLSFH